MTAARSEQLTQVTEWSDGVFRPVDDSLAAEEPLEIRIDGRPLSVTMRTPGHDAELAAGFLLSEGIVESADQIASLTPFTNNAGGKSNGIDAILRDCEFDPAGLQRNFFAASSCGICGKASIDAIRQRGLRAPATDFTFDPEMLCALPDKLRAAQTVFSHTGGLHAAALFDLSGELVVVREDIGRHNAVDKIIGWAMAHAALPLAQHGDAGQRPRRIRDCAKGVDRRYSGARIGLCAVKPGSAAGARIGADDGRVSARTSAS